MKTFILLALVAIFLGRTDSSQSKNIEAMRANMAHVLDLDYYGLENEQTEDNELDWVKEIFEVEEITEEEELPSLEEDSEEVYSLEEDEEDEDSDYPEESEESNEVLEKKEQEERVKKDEKQRRRWKKKLARKQQRKALRKNEAKESDSEGKEENQLEVKKEKKWRRSSKLAMQKAKWEHKKAKWAEKRKRTQSKERPPKKCHGPVCKKIEEVVKKHEQMVDNLMVEVDEAGQLCLMTGQRMRVRPRVLRKLGPQRHDWISDWRTWQENVNVCCDVEDPEELTECVKTVGPLSVPWRHTTIDKKDENATSTIAEKLTRVCRRISRKDWSSLPERKVRRLNKHQELESQDRETLEQQWIERGQAMMDCCELGAESDRLECIEDLRTEKIDDLCDSQIITFHPIKQEAFKECCTMEDEDRYECFDGLPKWRRSHRHHKKHNKEHGNKENKQDKKKDPAMAALRRECCEQGREEGTAVVNRRWAACQREGFKFVEDRELTGKSVKMCGKVLRRCCVRQSRRTIVNDIFTTEIPTSLAE